MMEAIGVVAEVKRLFILELIRFGVPRGHRSVSADAIGGIGGVNRQNGTGRAFP